MAEIVDPTGGGEPAFGYLVAPGIPELIDRMFSFQALARSRGFVVVEEEAGLIIDRLLASVNRVALEFAGMSEGLIMRKMVETQTSNRPWTGNMESHVLSVAAGRGAVKVALIAELDKIRNPRGDFGPFWRAQEYGTGSDEVKSQVGRVLFGTFEPSGTAPDPSQRGLGQGTDHAFVPAAGQLSLFAGPGVAGRGRITEELPGRHFLFDGFTEAGAGYELAMAAVEAKFIAEGDAMMRRLRPRPGRGPQVWRGVIDA